VANPSVSEKFLSETDLRRIFKKQLSHWDDGTPITVLEQGGKSNARKAFYRNVLKSTADKMSLYWISQTMTHGIAPPVVHSSRRRVLSQIARTPGAIGFVSAGPANSAVRIIGSD
jgi:ABC-type phosphate transport system substrate-binding protein